MGFARNLILFLFEREHEGYKRFADCTVFPYTTITGGYRPAYLHSLIGVLLFAAYAVGYL